MGFALGLALLAAIYLTPLLRLRLARGPQARRRLVEEQRRYLRRLEDDLALRQEHGDRDSEEISHDVVIHRRVVRRMERQVGEDPDP